ncbi:hypothetical protein QFZ58_006375 [Streptomyces sp. B1I3]|nr:hypothetical protein [Streptomyces sp. B1I3]
MSPRGSSVNELMTSLSTVAAVGAVSRRAEAARRDHAFS